MNLNDLRNREMPFIELSAIGWRLYQANFKKILLLTIIFCFPINIVLTVIETYITNIAVTVDFVAILNDPALMRQFLLSPEYGRLLGNTLFSGLIQLLFMPLCTVAVAYLIKKYTLGENIGYRMAAMHSFSKAVPLMITALLHGLFVFIGCLLFIIPGLVLAISYYLFEYAFALSDKRYFNAMRYSSSLVKGKWARTFGIAVVIYIVNYGFTSIIQILMSFFGTSFFVMVVMRMLMSLETMYFTVVLTLLFLNREYLLYGGQASYKN